MENLKEIANEKFIEKENEENKEILLKENLEKLRFNFNSMKKSVDEFTQKIIDRNKDLIEYEKQKKLLSKNEEEEDLN